MSNHREFANQSVTKASLGLDQQVEESDKAASSPFPADASAGASFRLGDAEVFRKIDSQSVAFEMGGGAGFAAPPNWRSIQVADPFLEAPSMGKSVDPFTSGGGPFLSSSMHGFGDEGFNGDNDSFGFGGYRDASEPHPHPHPHPHTHPHTHAHTTKGKGKDKQMLSTAPTPLMATPAASTTTTTPTPTPTPSSNLTAQIAASAAASAAAGVDVMPPCVPGGYLEPHCHFFTRASPRTVEGAVTSFLNDCESQVDFERRPIKYKLKCVSYSRGGARMNFNVRIFTADKTAGDDNDGAGDGNGDGNGGATPRLIVEFQRRSGCPCHFQAIYGAAIAKLRADGIIADDAASSSTSDDGDSLGMSALSLESPSPRSSSSLEPPSFADLMAASGDTFDTVGDDASSSLSSSASVLDDFAAPCADTLRSLLHMAESPHMDVKSEALHALAEISAPARTRDGSDGGAIDECSALVASQIANDDALLSLLCKSLADEYEDVHRCAATSLANVTEARCTVACQRLTTLNIVPLLRSLTVATSTRQVVREALRALCNLVAVLDVDVLDDDLRASLDAMCDDRSIRSYYDTLLGHTAAATTAVPSQ